MQLGDDLCRAVDVGRAARGGHERLLLVHALDVLVSLVDAANVGGPGDLADAREADLLHGGDDLSELDLVRQVTGDSGGDASVDLLALLDRLEGVDDLRASHDGAERARTLAASARDAALLVEHLVAVGEVGDGANRARSHARDGDVDDGMVRAHRGALAALDTLGGVDHTTTVDVGDGVLRAVGLARLGDAVLARVGDEHLLHRALVARLLDDGQHRGLDVLDLTLQRHLDKVRERLLVDDVLDGLHIETEDRADSVSEHVAILVDAAAVNGRVLRLQEQRQLVDVSLETVLHVELSNVGNQVCSQLNNSWDEKKAV